MSLSRSIACSIVLAGSFAAVCGAQAPGAEEKARSIEGGGITVPGWQGMVDAGAAKQGQSVKDDKLAPEGKGFRVTTGPAVDFWNPKNMGKGDFTVSATFNE